MSTAEALIHPDAARAMRDAIADADGNEVFFVGRPDREHAVAEVQVLARGHGSAVPGLLPGVHTGEVVIHNHPSGHLTPSDADLSLAARWGAMGVAFVIVDNLAERSYTVVEPHRAPELQPIEDAAIEQAFGPEGQLAARLDGYEQRPPQVAMAREVARSFNQDRVALIEAGTGTGKSLAYLLPAVLFATANRTRIVISTNTINLQEQLIGKDLPFLADQLGYEFRAVLLKGRSNYLCLRKAAFAGDSQESLFEAPEREILSTVLDWSGKTEVGSKAELPFLVPADVWREVASDGDDCMRARSPFYSRCFFYNSRREAASADIIVVNHHLLMADLAARAITEDYTTTAVLPPYERVVIDEAHNLEDVAASYFGAQLTGLGLKLTLGRLLSERDQQRGVLRTLALTLGDDESMADLIEEAVEERSALNDAIDAAFASIIDGTCGFLGVDEPGSEELKLRLTDEVLEHPAIADSLVPACRELTQRLGAFVQLLGRVVRAAQPWAEDERASSALLRIGAVRNRLEAAAEVTASFPKVDDEQCRWIELGRRRRGQGVVARLARAPVEVSELLADNVYQRLKSVVMTSATMTVGQRFDHVASRLGVDRVDRERTSTVRLESPFDFAEQALILAPTDLPEPSEPRFAPAITDAIREAVIASSGRAFVLFTSYGLLLRVHRALEKDLREAGLNPLRQGEANRDALLRRFRREAGSVLFAVDSFWEGVDVPGEALSLVILTRLPFRVPSEPLQQSRVEAIQRAGRDPFRDYSVPQAVIKFRQGFGRLIRTRTDSGAVLVLDSRVVRKRYGKTFLDSLPPARRVARPWREVAEELKRFFG